MLGCQCPSPAVLGLATIRKRLILAALAAQLFASEALAVDFGVYTLAAGESRSARIGSAYRDIHVCNDSGSSGDLVVVIGDHDPFSLAPGNCKWDHGDRITLRNDSKGIVYCVFQVTGIHQS
jgi:hypothetical protein